MHCGVRMLPTTSRVLTVWYLLLSWLYISYSQRVCLLKGATAPLPPSLFTSVSLVLGFEAAVIPGQTLTGLPS